MPTGYTDMLDRNNCDTKTWIVEGLARAFGVCVTLRDDRMDLSKDEILKRLKCENTRIIRENAERLKEIMIKRDKHNNTRKELLAIIDRNDIDDTTRKIAKYGIEQLDLVQSELDNVYTEQECNDWLEFRKREIAQTRRDINYYEKEMKEEQERNMDRYEAYQKIIKDVEKIFGKK